MKNIFTNNASRNRLFIVAISIVIFIIACFLPCLKTTLDDGPYYGYQILSNGWIAIFGFVPTWFSNIAYLFVMLYFIRNKLDAAIGASIIMVLLMATIIMLLIPMIHDFETYKLIYIQHVYSGAYLWIISLLLPLFFSILYKIKANKHSSAAISTD